MGSDVERRIKVGPNYDGRWWWAVVAPDGYVFTDGIEPTWDEAATRGRKALENDEEC